MTHMQTNDIAKAKAEAAFKRKEAQARDGAVAMTEYRAKQDAVRVRTERLRALRLAKEEQERNAPSKPQAGKA